jgi:hypothetical protein
LNVTILNFDDGEEFDLQGPLRAEQRQDGWYVIGGGFLCPVDNHEDAIALITALKNTGDVR